MGVDNNPIDEAALEEIFAAASDQERELLELTLESGLRLSELAEEFSL